MSLAELVAAHRWVPRLSECGCGWEPSYGCEDRSEAADEHAHHVAAMIEAEFAVVAQAPSPERCDDVRLYRWQTSQDWVNTVLWWPGEGISINDVAQGFSPTQARALAAALLAVAVRAERPEAFDE